MTTQANLYVDQGTTFIVSLDLTDEEGDFFEIINQSFFCNVKKVYSSSPLFSANVAVTPGPPVNDLTLTIHAEQTRDLDPGKYQYDVVMIDTNGLVTKLLEGLIYLVPTVTTIPD